jgi:hypothetical protein
VAEKNAEVLKVRTLIRNHVLYCTLIKYN